MSGYRRAAHGAKRPFECIVRLENGKLAEHWDVIQDEAKKEASRSGLPIRKQVSCLKSAKTLEVLGFATTRLGHSNDLAFVEHLSGKRRADHRRRPGRRDRC
jgi:hypothetical protein